MANGTIGLKIIKTEMLSDTAKRVFYNGKLKIMRKYNNLGHQIV